MLRKYIGYVLRMPDANTDGSSSSPSSTATDQQGTVDNQDANKGAEDSSAAAKEDDKTPKNIDEAADALIVKALETSTSSVDEDGKEPKGAVQTLDKTPKVGEGKEPLDEKKDGKKDETVVPLTEEQKAEADKKLPFHEHPRWKEVMGERTQLKQQVAELQPFVEAQKSTVAYCQTNGIDPQQFQQALQMVALINKDPAEALKALTPTYEGLRSLIGESIAPDLQAKVTEGTLSEEDAKEMTKLRATAKMSEVRSKQVSASSQQQTQQQNDQAIQQALTSWDASQRATDPEYALKESLIVGQFASINQANPPKTAAQVIANANAALKAVNETLTKFAPKPARKKPLLSDGSSTTAKVEPKTMDEVAAEVAARHGII